MFHVPASNNKKECTGRTFFPALEDLQNKQKEHVGMKSYFQNTSTASDDKADFSNVSCIKRGEKRERKKEKHCGWGSGSLPSQTFLLSLKGSKSDTHLCEKLQSISLCQTQVNMSTLEKKVFGVKQQIKALTISRLIRMHLNLSCGNLCAPEVMSQVDLRKQKVQNHRRNDRIFSLQIFFFLIQTSFFPRDYFKTSKAFKTGPLVDKGVHDVVFNFAEICASRG